MTPWFSPRPVWSVWDSSNAQKAVSGFYKELAKELDIPLLLTARSHVWRTTLNSEWADLGVSAERRAAYFGHSPEINRQAYTDLVDLEELANTVEGRM